MAENWTWMKAADAISGKEGTLFATIDGNVTAVAECKSFSAKIAKQKAEFKALGYRGTQHKATGWSGTGTLTIYYATSLFTKMMIDYAKNGIDQYFKLVATNEDPTSSIGSQTVTLTDVNLDDVEISKLDTDATFLDQQINFTFSGAEIDPAFGKESESE